MTTTLTLSKLKILDRNSQFLQDMDRFGYKNYNYIVAAYITPSIVDTQRVSYL